MGDTGVLGWLIDELLEVEGRDSGEISGTMMPSLHDLRPGEIIACILHLDAHKYLDGVVGAGVQGREESSTLTGTGLRMNFGLIPGDGESVSKGVNTNVFWVRSHSAVNVSAVPGVAAVCGVARVVPSGRGDGGKTRWTPLTKPCRRTFLMFNGAVSATGTACETNRQHGFS
jgi:hypothetical protein